MSLHRGNIDKPQIKFTYARRKHPKAPSVEVSSFATLLVSGWGGGVEGGGGGGVEGGGQGREVVVLVERILHCEESGASRNTPLLSLFS